VKPSIAEIYLLLAANKNPSHISQLPIVNAMVRLTIVQVVLT